VADIIRFENTAEAAGWKKAVESYQGNGMQYAQFVLFTKMASAYQSMMVNTADSPIMKVFEAFESAAETSPPKTAVIPRDETTTSTQE
jgi:hypothetical protein